MLKVANPAAPVKKVPVKKAAAKRSPAKKPKETPAVPQGEMIYKDVEARVCSGPDAMTAEQMKKILGWEEVTDKALFTDPVTDKKVILTNNLRNRPFTLSHAMLFAQEILRKKWAGPNGLGKTINGEPMIVGQFGETISIQHRGVGLILAAEMYAKEPDKYPQWDREPVMDTLLVLGVCEDDEVVNTIDTGRPRSLSDVIYRSEYFASADAKQRVELARAAGFAVGQLWERTGVEDAFGIRKTHAEALDLINRHPRLLAAVKHTWEEDGDKKPVTKYAGGVGYAAGLMFLMGCSASDSKAYYSSTSPNEDMLDWSLWKLAEDFWVCLAAGEKKFAALREALGLILKTEGPEGQHVRGTRDEKLAVLIKAWQLFAQGKPITAEGIALKYSEPDDEGVCHLIECPTTGGIDKGKTNEGEEQDTGEAPTQEQIAERAAAIKAKNKAQPIRRPSTADVGHKVWVVTPDNPEATWFGELVKLEGDKAFIKVGKGLAAHGKTLEAPFSQVQTTEPAE